MTTGLDVLKLHQSASAAKSRTIVNWVIVLIFFIFSTVTGQQMLFVVASECGESGIGTIFMTNADGTGLEVKKSFQAIPGRSPSYTNLIQSTNGKIYGMTAWGGAYQKGVCLSIIPVTVRT